VFKYDAHIGANVSFPCAMYTIYIKKRKKERKENVRRPEAKLETT
jgi:hypothetical protein